MVIEFDRRALRNEYGDDLGAMKRAQDYVEWNEEHVRKCFNFGHGTEKDLAKYVSNNRKYAIFREVQ